MLMRLRPPALHHTRNRCALAGPPDLRLAHDRNGRCTRSPATMGDMRTRLTEMLGIEHPVMLAGMGGVSYHALVAAVSDAGGFGTLGAATMQSDELDKEMAAVKAATD